MTVRDAPTARGGPARHPRAQRAPRGRCARARPSRCRGRTARRPLAGVPYTLKDTWDTPGMPTTGGSWRHRERVPDEAGARVRGARGDRRGAARQEQLLGPRPRVGELQSPRRRDAQPARRGALGRRQLGRRGVRRRVTAWPRSTGAPTSAGRSAFPRRAAASSACACRAGRGRSTSSTSRVSRRTSTRGSAWAPSRERSADARAVLARAREAANVRPQSRRSCTDEVALYAPGPSERRPVADVRGRRRPRAHVARACASRWTAPSRRPGA